MLNAVSAYQADQQIQETVRSSSGALILLPEAVIKDWNSARELFWQTTIIQLRARHQTVAIGVGLPISGKRDLANGIIFRGFDNLTYQQRIPVPIGMWGRGAPLYWMGPATITIADHHPGILICWEQLLVLPPLQSFWSGADSMLAVSNLHWTQQTRIDQIQRDCLDSWSALFDIPQLRAVNR